MYDVLIIGAGITGTMIARDLSRYRLNVALVDKEADIADGTTMANSAIVHTGYDPQDGTMKAKMNVRGAGMYEQLCRDLGCEYRKCGAYVAACGEEEEKHLDILADRAERRNIPYEFLSGDEARKWEENLSDNVTKVLSFPTTAIIYPWDVAIACAEVAVKNGMDLHLNSPVTKIERTENGWKVRAGEKELETKVVINAAGVYADKIYGMVSKNPGFSITPRKGEYFVLDNDKAYVHHIIFPVPTAKGKGVLAIPTVHGNTLFGPDSDPVEDKDDKGCTRDGLAYVRANVSRLLKAPAFNKSIRSFAGLRPTPSTGDFIIEEAKDAEGFINVAGIESPGLASAPAIGEYVVKELVSKRLPLEENPDAVMSREAPIVTRTMDPEKRSELIKAHPEYGRIICRCIEVSEGEIVDCIRRPCGASTIKGVKKRVGPGFGRCQGGFCEPRVLGILARELNIRPTEVVLDEPGSRILEKENR